MYFILKCRKKIMLYSLCSVLLIFSLGFGIYSFFSQNNTCNECAINVSTNSAIIQPDNAEKYVYLTFDDGPSPVTEKILDTLKEFNVPATFFVIADENSKPYFNLITRAENEGHLIALHTATHNYKQIYKSSEAFWADIDVLRTEIEPYIKTNPTVMRFPGGSNNTVSQKYGPARLMDTLKEQAIEKGYSYYDWNVCVNDSVGSSKSREEIVRAAINIGKKNNCVVLFHDSKVNKSSADALAEIIRWYQDSGFTFCTLADYHG